MSENLGTPKADGVGSIGKSGKEWGTVCTKGITSGGVAYTLPTADGSDGHVLKTNGSGTLAWTGTGSAATFDEIGDAGAAGTIAMTSYAQTLTSTKTDGDNFNIQGLGAFGDISVLRVEQKTGNPTDGTVLEVVAADANVDPLVVSSSALANALVVGQNAGTVTVGGILAVTGATTMTGALTVNGASCVGDGATAMSGFIRTIVDAGATNPTTLTIADSGKVFFSSQAVEFDLPDAATGLEYTFVVNHVSNLHIDPAAGDTILYGGCSAGDRLVADAVGESITLVGINATSWAVKSLVGTWTDDN